MVIGEMKTFLVMFMALIALAGAAGVFVFDVLSERGGHDGSRGKEMAFAAEGMSRNQYIAYLMRTERHDNPELWRRIAAVRNIKEWKE